MDSIRKVVRFVAIANLSYFCVEFFFAQKIGSVSLFADSIDFLNAIEVTQQTGNQTIPTTPVEIKKDRSLRSVYKKSVKLRVK